MEQRGHESASSGIHTGCRCYRWRLHPLRHSTGPLKEILNNEYHTRLRCCPSLWGVMLPPTPGHPPLVLRRRWTGDPTAVSEIPLEGDRLHRADAISPSPHWHLVRPVTHPFTPWTYPDLTTAHGGGIPRSRAQQVSRLLQSHWGPGQHPERPPGEPQSLHSCFLAASACPPGSPPLPRRNGDASLGSSSQTQKPELELRLEAVTPGARPLLSPGRPHVLTGAPVRHFLTATLGARTSQRAAQGLACCCPPVQNSWLTPSAPPTPCLLPRESLT